MDKQENSMAIDLPTITIAELHKQLQAYIDQGLGDVPVVATDCARRLARGYSPRNEGILHD